LQEYRATFLLYNFPTDTAQRDTQMMSPAAQPPEQGTAPPQHRPSAGAVPARLERLLFGNGCPPSILAPMTWWVFLLFREVPAIYPTSQLGFAGAQRGRTCRSLYSESTARQGIRARSPAGIAALARTAGPCSPVLFLVCQEKSLSVANRGGTL